MRSRLGPLLLLLLAVACARTTLKSSVAAEHGGTDEFAELDFWEGISEAKLVTNQDALHAMLLSVEQAQAGADYTAEVRRARERGWVKESWNKPANETAQTGLIARAICIEYDIEGGVTMRVLGPRPRYAVHQLTWLGLLPTRGTKEALSGLELIALLSNVEDFATADDTKPEDLE